MEPTINSKQKQNRTWVENLSQEVAAKNKRLDHDEHELFQGDSKSASEFFFQKLK